MIDGFKNFGDSTSHPARGPYAIVPSDNDALPRLPKGIFVGSGGDIVLRGVDASADVTYRNLPDASYVNVRAAYVRATGTTAANLIAEA